VIDEEAAHLEILDTTIGEENSDMQEQYLRTGDGFLILYNVASRATFEDISTLQRQVLKAKGKDYWPMVWVGYHGNLEEQREITLTQGEMTARKCGCAFFEVSTDLKDNIEKAFFELVRDIRRYNVFDEKWKRMEKKNYPAKIKPTQKQTRKRGVSPSRRRRRARNTSQGVIQERFGNMKIE
jgi:GTPase KRas protein